MFRIRKPLRFNWHTKLGRKICREAYGPNQWRRKQLLRHQLRIRAPRGFPTLSATLSTVLHSNVWRYIAQIKVNVRSNLIITKSARKEREKRAWNAIRPDHYFHEYAGQVPFFNLSYRQQDDVFHGLINRLFEAS